MSVLRRAAGRRSCWVPGAPGTPSARLLTLLPYSYLAPSRTPRNRINSVFECSAYPSLPLLLFLTCLSTLFLSSPRFLLRWPLHLTHAPILLYALSTSHPGFMLCARLHMPLSHLSTDYSAVYTGSCISRFPEFAGFSAFSSSSSSLVGRLCRCALPVVLLT